MQVQRVQNYQSSFQAKIPKAIPTTYKTSQAKANTIAVLGSSKTTDDILKYMDICSNSVKSMVLSGKNIVTGCGTSGIMGEAYKSGCNYSLKNKNNLPKQNLGILTKPLWGDEDLEHCIPIGCAKSEAGRIEMFSQVADTILIFPGSTGTLQEAATLISKNNYGKSEDKKKIILVGKKFFKGLIEQYNKLYKSGLIKHKPSELFTVVDSEKELNGILK